MVCLPLQRTVAQTTVKVVSLNYSLENDDLRKLIYLFIFVNETPDALLRPERTHLQKQGAQEPGAEVPQPSV